MSTIGAYEAKTKFSELLERVEKGEHFTLTRHGQVVAELALGQKPSLDPGAFRIDRFTGFTGNQSDLTLHG